MRIPILISAALILLSACSTSTSNNISTTKDDANNRHAGHSKSKGSLTPECLNASALPSPHCGRVPSLAFDDDGVLYAVFSQNGHIYITTSPDKGRSYNSPVVVNTAPERIYDDGENRPKILLGKRDEIFVSWTHKTPGRYSGDVRFARSLDKGKHFDTPITINADQSLISHRFDAMSLDQDGRIFITWIDKRDQQKAKDRQQEYAGASIYYAISEDNGVSFKTNYKLADHSCECCRIAMDSDSDGKVVALWRHVYPGNIRDHAISYIDSQGASIKGLPTKATDDAWQIEGCPHHGPDIAIDQQNIAHMAWFSQGMKNKGLMYGQFDLQNEQSTSVQSIDAKAGAARPQVEVMGQSVYLLWKRFNGISMSLLTRYSNDKGKSWSEDKIIATTANGSDHPDWIRDRNDLYASWQTQSEGLTLIKVTQ